MPSGLFQLLPRLLRLSKPAGASGLLSGTYYFLPSDRPPIGSMVVTTKLDDVAVDDVTTYETGATTNAYSGVCAQVSTLLVATALADLGTICTLTSWSAQARVVDIAAESPACVLPPEIELAPAYQWWLETSEDDTTYTLRDSGTLTPGTFNALGGALSSVSARYVRLITRIYSDQYRATGGIIYAHDADLRLYGTSTGTGGGTPAPPGPELEVLGVCEGGQATIWQGSLVAGASYYEIWRITDSEPAPGVLVASGGPFGIPGGAVDADPFVDAPLPIGRPVTYRVRGCNASGCGPATEVTITPCWPDGTDGACPCSWAPEARVVINATPLARAIVEARRESC